MKFLVSLILSSLLISGGEWGGSLENAKAEATKSNKYILLNFCGSDWCGPCIKLKQNVFESEEFKKFATDKLVLIRADFPRLKKNKLSAEQTTNNDALAEKYNPQGKFPFTVLIDSKGGIVKEWDGYPKSLTSLVLIHDIHLATAPK